MYDDCCDIIFDFVNKKKNDVCIPTEKIFYVNCQA